MTRQIVDMMRSGRLVVALAVGLLAGCSEFHHKRLNAPPQGEAEHRSDSQSYYAYMNDNAMLHDMSLTDVHFVPNQTALSGTGESRLERYAELLRDMGGTLHYLAFGDSEDLTSARLEVARRFLADHSLGGQAILVQAGMPRGRSTDAVYAIEAREMGTQVPKPSEGIAGTGGGSGTTTGAAPSGTGGASSPRGGG